MPELPEVETVRRGLAKVLDGRLLTNVVVRRPDLRRPFPDHFAERLTGRRVGQLKRRAKYLIAPLDDGWNLLIHLGMSGRVMILEGVSPESCSPESGPHDHVELFTEDGMRIVYRDPRRFGVMDLYHTDEAETYPLLASLGPEPLEPAFTAKVLAERLERRASPIKTALLDQRAVAGLGNIYVCESLYLAGISPFRAASSLTKDEWERLTAAIRDVLERAIAAGGSTLRDHRQPDGELGYFQHAFNVYDREEEPCPLCLAEGRGPHSVRRVVQGGRSTFYCSRHQI